MLSGQIYWLVVESTAPQTTSNFLVLPVEVKGSTSHSWSPNGTTWATPIVATPIRMWNVPFKDQGVPENNFDWMVMGNDRNGQARLGPVERTVSSIPIILTGYRQSKSTFTLGYT